MNRLKSFITRLDTLKGSLIAKRVFARKIQGETPAGIGILKSVLTEN